MNSKTLFYVLKRIGLAILTIWVVITITFFVMHAVPGGPFVGEKATTPAVQAAMEAKYGLDKPVLEQYFTYLGDIVLRFDFGPSLKQRGRQVIDIIADGMKVSARLGLIAAFGALALDARVQLRAAGLDARSARGMVCAEVVVEVVAPLAHVLDELGIILLNAVDEKRVDHVAAFVTVQQSGQGGVCGLVRLCANVLLLVGFGQGAGRRAGDAARCVSLLLERQHNVIRSLSAGVNLEGKLAGVV